MKRFVFLLTTIFMCSISHAETFNQYWYVENNLSATTQCTTGGDIILPTAPTKYGYDFIGWEKLPYIRIEYLESTGTQWIDTGVYANGGSKIEAKGKTINKVFHIGSIDSTGGNPDNTRNLVTCIASVPALYFQKLNYFNNNRRVIIDIDEPFTFVFNTIGSKYEFMLNGVQVYSENTRIMGIQPNTIKIGYSDWEPIIVPGRYYYVKIWDSTETLVRDFIPVLDGDGVPCMYDKVEGKFYYNAGTGDFIAGPVIGELLI